MCPAFVADNLETLEEIGMQGKETFEAAGGERYTLIPCLNAQQSWVDSLARWCLDAEPRHKRSASEGSRAQQSRGFASPPRRGDRGSGKGLRAASSLASPSPNPRLALDACRPPNPCCQAGTWPPRRARRRLSSRARPSPLRPVGAIDEDCLHLNIQAPRTPGPHPVWVWIYGGGFTNGDARDPIHEAARLVEKHQVVVVTLNYRLGLLGFPPLSEAANLGLLDQQAALHWVKANIEAFGGNPSQTTLLGESAGGMSILAQLTLAGSDGTFERAVIQSAATSPWLDEMAVDRCAQWLRTTLGTLDLPACAASPPPRKAPELGAALDEALRPALGHGVFLGPSRARRGSARRRRTASPGQRRGGCPCS